MIKVLMCGNHPSNKGGMTSVIKQIRDNDWMSVGIKMKFIPTYYPGNTFVKFLYFIFAYLKILICLIFDRPNIVHMHMSYKGSFERKYIIHKTCKIFGISDVIHLHGSEFKKWYNEVNDKKKKQIRTLIKEADAFVVLGEKWKKNIKNIEKNSDLYILHNCISIPKEKVKWNEQTCEIVFLGVLIQRKGIIDLLKTIKILMDKHLIQNLHFTIAGVGEDENKLKRIVNEYGITSYVDFVGWVAENTKNKLLMNSQIMILPSYNEGLPISILEALAYGMPVISTDVGDIPSVVSDKKNGLLFKPGNVKQMMECILFATTKKNFMFLSRNAKETSEKYSIELFYQNLEKIYKELSN